MERSSNHVFINHYCVNVYMVFDDTTETSSHTAVCVESGTGQ